MPNAHRVYQPSICSAASRCVSAVSRLCNQPFAKPIACNRHVIARVSRLHFAPAFHLPIAFSTSLLIVSVTQLAFERTCYAEQTVYNRDPAFRYGLTLVTTPILMGAHFSLMQELGLEEDWKEQLRFQKRLRAIERELGSRSVDVLALLRS